MGVDIAEGVSRISQLLQPEQPSNEAEQPETVEAEEVLQEEPETEVVESETEETPQSDTESDPLYTVKVNGEEREVTLEELRKGYMMESDYRRKTSDVAREKEVIQGKYSDLDAKIKEAETLLKFEQGEFDSQEMKELKEYDPTAYYEKREKIEQRKQKLKDLKSALDDNAQSKKLEKVEKEKDLLFQAIPEWLDDSVLKSEADMINGLWNDYGFTPEDLDQYSDHRLVAISRKAALYDKLMSAKPQAKKITPKPKTAEPGIPKATSEGRADKVREIKAKVKKTGNMRDAAKAIKQLIR